MTSKPSRKSNGKAPPGATPAAAGGAHNEIAASYYSAALFIKEIVDGAHVAGDTRARTETLAKLARLSVQGLAGLFASGDGTVERDMLAAETLIDAGITFFEAGRLREGATLRVAAARLHGRDDARGDAEKIIQVARLTKHALALSRQTALGNAAQLCDRIAQLGFKLLDAHHVRSLLDACAIHTAPSRPGLPGTVAKLCLDAGIIKRKPKQAVETQRKTATGYVAKVLRDHGVSNEPELWRRADRSMPYGHRTFTVERLSFAPQPFASR